MAAAAGMAVGVGAAATGWTSSAAGAAPVALDATAPGLAAPSASDAGGRRDPARSPLRGLAPPVAGDLDHGTVRERLEAGPYTYLRIEDAESGRETWLVTLGAGASVGSEIDAQSFGTREAFASKRLGRTFARLTFGLITHERTNGEER